MADYSPLLQRKYTLAVDESTKALELSPNYVKALMRRAQAQEKLDKYDEAVTGMLQKTTDFGNIGISGLRSVRGNPTTTLSTFLRIWFSIVSFCFNLED